MPGATPVYGFPYPLLGEPIDPGADQALAEAIDAAFATHDAAVRGELDRPMLHLLNIFPSQTITVAVETALQWTEFIDNSGMFNPASPADITIQRAGVYGCTHRGGTLTGFTTKTSQRQAVYLSGVQRFGERKNDEGTPETTFHGLIAASAGEVVQVRLLWTGTGGPATVFDTDFLMYYICPL